VEVPERQVSDTFEVDGDPNGPDNSYVDFVAILDAVPKNLALNEISNPNFIQSDSHYVWLIPLIQLHQYMVLEAGAPGRSLGGVFR
jgi:hypothetical protein